MKTHGYAEEGECSTRELQAQGRGEAPLPSGGEGFEDNRFPRKQRPKQNRVEG